ncbi:CD0519/CD1768 family membrane protein [Blautia sp.]|jgi:hypothetical protein|uniref:CD0519/CD1768 family membrane protein n=1 Tax=Blautia sp. TaxID=1955243 RepID=UPI00280B8AF5|nr:hypothetical protein [Blautia sp.]MDY3016788.1 hypothetical protein [Blautia sp.]
MERVAEKTKAKTKPAVGIEVFIFLAIFVGIFLYLGKAMGAVNMLNTMMNTGYQLLIDTVLYILAIAVLAGAISGLFTEFGVVALINKILSPLMKPLYALPGASIIGVLATYLSDNPAILTLAKQTEFKRYFKKYQFPALTNIGTAFGMGLVITTFMIGIKNPAGGTFIIPALIGNLGAVIGSIVSVRIMLFFTAKTFGKEESCVQSDIEHQMGGNEREIRSGSLGNRILGAILDGGKSGVDMGLAIIPGVVVICTLVMMLTNGPSASGEYTGAAYEGIALLPALGDKLRFILEPLFGFTSSKGVAVPITALGAAGAAIGLVPKMVQDGIAVGNDIAVFTAMCMCWSGYLSTHVAMMDSLKCKELTGKAIFSHTIGGLCAGVSAHWIYQIIATIF